MTDAEAACYITPAENQQVSLADERTKSNPALDRVWTINIHT